MQIRRKGNIKKKVGLLGVFLVFFSLIFISAPPAYAGTITEYTVDSGQFNTWLHSDGVTWQNIPGYGRVKPLDTVRFTYVVPYDGNNLSKVKGVKAVYFYNGDKTIYEKSPRASWQPYSIYFTGDYHEFSVKSLTVNSYTYLGSGKVQITITAKLDTHTIYQGLPGLFMHEPFQGSLTQGRKFYTPTVIEWEIEGTGHSLTVQIEGQGSTTPAGSKAPGTVHQNMSGSVAVNASPANGWKFSKWVDVTAGNTTFSVAPNSFVNVNQNKTIRAVFIPADETPPPSKQEYLTVVPSSRTLFVNDNYSKFNAYYHKSDGTSTNVTKEVGTTWKVADTKITTSPTPSHDGISITGLREGNTQLIATYKGLEGTSDITVIPEPVPPPPNYKPQAEFEISNPTPVEGESIVLHDKSIHKGEPNEYICDWEWEIETPDGTEIMKTNKKGDKLDFTWNEVGTYKITLTVEDCSEKYHDYGGDKDSISKSVVVGPALPAAVIKVEPKHFILGRKVKFDGDESTAAMDRTIKWDEMEWEFIKPDGKVVKNTERYPVLTREKANSLIDQTGRWKVRLKVKDSNNNESEWAEEHFVVYPDSPPTADFWVVNETLRYSYDNNIVKVHDVSTPGSPDSSMGDEIFSRKWILYYDANNNGKYDEIILAGEKGKSAELIEANTKKGNDPNPEIKFYKTGNYKLELEIQERYYDDWIGEYVLGKTADTSDKFLKEKEIMVINMAPVLTFDVKKKVPIDVVFGIDASLTDSKYINLLSADAEFKNKLESAYIIPKTKYTKAEKGEITEILNTQLMEFPLYDDWAAYSQNLLGKTMFSTTSDGKYNLILGKTDAYYDYELGDKLHIDMNDGEIKSGHLPIKEEPDHIYYNNGKTSNGKYDILTEPDSLRTYQNGKLVFSRDIPTLNYPAKNGVEYVAPWGEEETIVIYGFYNYEYNKNNERWIDGDGYLYAYIINNNTGAISEPVLAGDLLRGVNYDHRNPHENKIRKIAPKTIAVEAISYREDYRHDKTKRKYFIINANLNVKEFEPRSTPDDIYLKILPFNNNLFQIIEYVNWGSDIYKYTPPQFYDQYGNRVQNSNYTTMGLEWDENTRYRNHIDMNAGTVAFNDGSYAITKDGKVEFYNKDGYLKWSYNNVQQEVNLHPARTKKEIIQMNYYDSISVNKGKPFLDYIILKNSWVNNGLKGGSNISLLDRNTGEVKHVFTPLSSKFPSGSDKVITENTNIVYLWNDEDYLFYTKPYRLKDKNYYTATLNVIGQLPGLQKLAQTIKGYPWEGEHAFAVSVTDKDKYIGELDEIIKALGSEISFTSIAPDSAMIKSQTQKIVSSTMLDGWWIETNKNMSIPLNELANKIIEYVNKDRGADNIVLVNQEVEFRANYDDAENDEAEIIEWKFKHDPTNVNGITLSNGMGLSKDDGKVLTINPEAKDNNFATLPWKFDKVGTWQVYAKAKDKPNTNPPYLIDSKAGAKWSDDKAYLNVIVHRKPIARFSIGNSSSNKPGNTLAIVEDSYDLDLEHTDPIGKKGIRVWQWQYIMPDGKTETITKHDRVAPKEFTLGGKYEIRLRVQDNFGAWSDWTETKTFNIVNRPPIANFTVDPNPASVGNRSMVIDSSYDLDGEDEIIEWKWEIEKGLGETETIIRTSSAPFPYIWNMEGVFNVKLTVKDIEGATGSITKPVTVLLNHPPVAVIKLPAEIFTDEWFTADGTSSYDPDGDIITKAYWQYMKPGDTNWSATHTQELGGSFTVPKESFLKYPIYPQDGEHGVWKLRLIVEDDKGLASLPAEVSFNILEGWEITGSILPEVGERGRYMRVMAYAHRKNKPNEKYTIDSMKAELVYLDEALTKSGRAAAESIETLNMPYDSSKADFRQDYLVGEKVYDTNRWPADGRYYVKVIGQKGSTQKHIAIPYSIKGNIHQRLYIRTYSW